MVQEKCILTMETPMRACGKMVLSMEKGSTHGLMATFTKVASGQIKDKAKELFITQQEVDTKGTGKMIKSRVKVFFSKTKGLLKLLILE